MCFTHTHSFNSHLYADNSQWRVLGLDHPSVLRTQSPTLVPDGSSDAFQLFRQNLSGAERPLSHLYLAGSPTLSHPSLPLCTPAIAAFIFFAHKSSCGLSQLLDLASDLSKGLFYREAFSDCPH